jgi:multiple sugar transport system substrate-binding protein
MSATVRLRGMAWDHPRALDPLNAIARAWQTQHGVAVHWDARPLKDFEDQPLEELANAYDLVLLDYPFVGFAADSGLIAPVEDWADTDYLADQAAHSVGPSNASYRWGGKQWALAIDAACQVSAVREDLWNASGRRALPSTWDDVAAAAVALRSSPSAVALPLNANHAYCAFLSLGLSYAGERFWPAGGEVDAAAAHAALEFLRRLAPQLHPASRASDPIAISDRMTRTDEIAYVPLMFGYSSYARADFRPRLLRFDEAPLGPSGRRGSVLGGVGLALSARSSQPDAAAALARAIGSGAVQAGVYARAGGQPGHAAAWDSADVNAQAGNFFAATRDTMAQAFMRPRVAGHRRFQPAAGELIHRCIWSGALTPAACMSEYGRLARTLLAHGNDVAAAS